MDFLKDILGEDLYSQVKSKVNEHNGAEENKDNQIKIGNLGSGQYVSKDKYASKESELAAKIQELLEANTLIGELKKDTKDNEEAQKKFTEYDLQIAELQKQVQETKIKSAIKVALMSEKALDVDYLTFKLNEKLKESGESLELDENENIKGWKDKIDGLKVQFPSQFETSTSVKKIEEHKLDKPEDKSSGTFTKSDVLKMSYQQRNQLASEHPEAYAQAMGR